MLGNNSAGYCNLQELFILQLSQLEATLALDTKLTETCAVSYKLDGVKIIFQREKRGRGGGEGGLVLSGLVHAFAKVF